VSFSGTAAESRIFFVSLSSDTAELEGAAQNQVTAPPATPAPKTFTFTVPEASVDDFDLSFTSPAIVHPASIKNTFGISATEETGVSDTFTAVHDYVSSRTAAQLAGDGIIQTGDYIDLEGGITVAGGYPFETRENIGLIVVGVNSFNEGGSAGTSDYTGNENGEDAHLVFQFRNLPFTHGMDNSATNGYAGSLMQAYLTGEFLPGLLRRRCSLRHPLGAQALCGGQGGTRRGRRSRAGRRPALAAHGTGDGWRRPVYLCRKFRRQLRNGGKPDVA
jgi:hypothetical protein